MGCHRGLRLIWQGALVGWVVTGGRLSCHRGGALVGWVVTGCTGRLGCHRGGALVG